MEAQWVLSDDTEVFSNTSNEDTLTCDYLVIGAGTRGMAFIDGLVAFKKTCSVIVADKRGAPGGQWHDLPGFCRVGQTSYNYGVPSRRLETVRLPSAAGKHERASRAQVLSYYDVVMEHFVKNGRVRFFPFCTVNQDGTEMTSKLGRHWRVVVKEKVVDATFMEWPLPIAREPPFKVHSGAKVVPPNDLASHRADSYMIIGAGRLGIDTLLYLLELGVPPSRLQWVVPRDMWYINREIFYPENIVDFQNNFGATLDKLDDLKEAYLVFEKKGVIYRLNSKIFPAVIHGGWISPTDAVRLRRIDSANNVIRMGHVREISDEYIVFDEGMYPTSTTVLHVDCTSSAMRCPKPCVPIWTDKRITVQQVTQATCGHGEWSVPLSASLIGYCEGRCDDIEENNQRCTPCHFPDGIGTWQRIHGEFYKCVDHLMESDAKIAWRLMRTRPSVFAVLGGDEMGRFTEEMNGNTDNTWRYHHSMQLADSWARRALPSTKLACNKNMSTQTEDDAEEQAIPSPCRLGQKLGNANGAQATARRSANVVK